MRTALLVLLLLAGGSVDALAQLRTRVYVSGLTQPIAFVQDPADPAVQFVVEQRGRIRVIRNGTVEGTDFLDLTPVVRSGGEQGLLGLAFPPDAGLTGRFYVNFTNTDGDTVIARFRRSANPLVADPSSRFDLRWNGTGGPRVIRQPFSNHNGGHLAFGPDGYLYIGLGDGGSGNDPDHRAQNPAELLGKFLRVDVGVPDSHPIGYQVPGNNPFLGGTARPEIWSFGWRNPWRYSFDDTSRGGTGALVAGDVGQNAWEEVNYEPRGRSGRNYGWRNREGAHNNVTSVPPAFNPLVDPIHEYDHSTGSSITGGYVYRGTALGSEYRGRYFFGDFVRSRVWSVALTVDAGGEGRASDVREHTTDFGGTSQLANVASFAVDAAGELYIVSYGRGVILKIIGPPPTPGTLRIIR
ncbi:MAG TPA: PQQ-dependent sugar dehydrogenase [Vicinamibacterales bacterium]|nr:PQQ-dependent sugar dehydrogenase [Vicinamibacterales bacterium]